jgi:hypothetical protein
MTPTEFREWYNHAIGSFPNLADWFAKAPDGNATYAAWQKVLEHSTLHGAKAGIDAMLAGRIERPKAWSDMPTAVRRYSSTQVADKAAWEAAEKRRADRDRDRWINDGTDETCIEMFERIERDKHGGPPKWKGVG